MQIMFCVGGWAQTQAEKTNVQWDATSANKQNKNKPANHKYFAFAFFLSRSYRPIFIILWPHLTRLDVLQRGFTRLLHLSELARAELAAANRESSREITLPHMGVNIQTSKSIDE